LPYLYVGLYSVGIFGCFGHKTLSRCVAASSWAKKSRQAGSAILRHTLQISNRKDCVCSKFQFCS